VFLLNVVAFLLMGMQARTIIGGMTAERLWEAARFAGLVVAAVILVRLFWVLAYNRLAKAFAVIRGDFKPAPLANGVLVGWCGMRGLITLATAFALPPNVPQRDLIVLTAFAVVLATLVLQGLTLAPLARLLRLDSDDSLNRELATARRDLAGTALATLDGEHGREADLLRLSYQIARDGAEDGEAGGAREKRDYGRRAIRRQREELEAMRADHRLGADAYLILQEELDFRELALVTEDERKIEEN
jgi:monovalent cation/hydrogen antiporter